MDLIPLGDTTRGSVLDLEHSLRDTLPSFDTTMKESRYWLTHRRYRQAQAEDDED